ncbi:TPA: hypothetical protein ACXM5A_003765 [Stenotrophomonas maltophilia]
MAFAIPEYSRKQVEKSGNILARPDGLPDEAANEALSVVSNWRAAHAHPLNTFQAALRNKLKSHQLDARSAPVGQRLKRLPSILAKLQRFEKMSLSRMQDIAGLRAVVPAVTDLTRIRDSYLLADRLKHELRTNQDYVAEPKLDGYRSIHLIYRYENSRFPQYNGLHVELQLRTRLQHAWATAIETVDTFAHQSIKAGRPTPEWGEFFLLASAAFANLEKLPLPTSLTGMTQVDINDRLQQVEQQLNVLLRLRGFSVAADKIQRKGRSASPYHLVVLDTERRLLNIKSYSKSDLDLATADYAIAEQKTARGEPIDAVLVSGGKVDQLRKTYPNYFLDTTDFLNRIAAICAGARNRRSSAR